MVHKRRSALAWGPAVVALVVAAVAFGGLRRANDLGAEAGRSNRIGAALSTVQLGLDDAETGQRGFLLTGDSSYLAPYTRGVAAVPPALDTLAVLLRGDATDAAVVDSLRKLTVQKFGELRRTMQARHLDGRNAAIEIVLSGRGKKLMDASRTLVLRLARREDRRLRGMYELQAGEQRRATFVLGIGIAVAVLLGMWANLWIVRESERLTVVVHERDAASKAKSDFLAMMSHEIRTPINAIMGYAELLAMGLSGPVTSEQAGQLGRIQSSSRHLLQLVNEVLDLAKIESGTLRVNTGRGQLAPTVAAAIDLVRTQASARDVALSNGVAPVDDVAYRGDQDRVRQILVNLLSNAVKFTPPGGSIVVDGRVTTWSERIKPEARGTPCLAITVSDTGIGVAADELDRIFEPFTQIDAGTRTPYTREHSGTGLGLPISRQLAHLMGGALTVESTVGLGSRFTLWLPVDAVESAVEGAVEGPATDAGLAAGQAAAPAADQAADQAATGSARAGEASEAVDQAAM